MSMVEMTVYKITDMAAYHKAYVEHLFPLLDESMLCQINKTKIIHRDDREYSYEVSRLASQYLKAIQYDYYDSRQIQFVRIDSKYLANAFTIGDSYNPTLVFKYEEVSE